MGKPDGSKPAPAVATNQSYSSGLAIGSKPDFETVYRNTPPPKKSEGPVAENK